MRYLYLEQLWGSCLEIPILLQCIRTTVRLHSFSPKTLLVQKCFFAAWLYPTLISGQEAKLQDTVQNMMIPNALNSTSLPSIQSLQSSWFLSYSFNFLLLLTTLVFLFLCIVKSAQLLFFTRTSSLCFTLKFHGRIFGRISD